MVNVLSMSRFYEGSSSGAVVDNPYGDPLSSQSPVELPSLAARQTGAPLPTVRRAPRQQPYPKFFHWMLLIYLFLYCSRLPELVPGMHIGYLMQPILLVGLYLTDRVKALWQLRLGRILIVFTGWVAVCVPTSVWLGGSVKQFLIVLQGLFLVAFMVGFIQNFRDIERVLFTMAIALGLVGILSLVGGAGKEGGTRFGLGLGGTTLRDPNFLALYLTSGLPFLGICAYLQKGAKRWAFLALMLPVLAGTARTGSRMGLVIVAVGGLMYFIFASSRQRILLVVAGIALGVAAIFFLPQHLKDRFMTIFTTTADTKEDKAAIESTEFRKELLIRSLQLTAEHPLLGVGPGMFMEADDIEAKSQGKTRGYWHYSHNSYTELSSETGLPGLILFIMALYTATKGLPSIRKRHPNAKVRAIAMFLQIAMIMVSIGAFFLSIGYGGIVYVIMTIAAIFRLMVVKQAKLARTHAC